jgi:Putative flagellar system-associated repeat/Secretion system C-terminal sorting domain
MTYSSDLANIIPATSAFNVQVNSVTRNVNSVAVSGPKVRLTLAGPVAYGDILKVSYTKPATKPLQTSSGGQAASISSQLITNNISAADPLPVKIKMTIYPNPAYRIINIHLENTVQETGISDRIIRIFDISGKLFLEKSIQTGTKDLQFPINLKPGIYVVVIFSANLEIASQNIIVN